MEPGFSTDAELPLGDVLGGRYRLDGLAGRGGMSRVYAATDLTTSRAVAVKMLRADFAEGARRERFVREIRLLEGFTHPHILPILDAGDAHGRLYYVMPLVPGRSLGDRLAVEPQLSVEETVRILLPVCDALAAAHARGIVHRDVKPDNILTSADGVWLADFGVARAVATVGGESLTQTGIAVGTPMYMSPEQASGLEGLDGRSDQYAVACVAYECLAGLPPFRGATPQVVARQRLMGPPQDIRLLRPEVSDVMAAVLTMALSVTPADRFPSIQAFAKALERAASAPRSATTAALQLPPVVLPRVHRGRRLVAAGALVTAAAGALAWAMGPRLGPSAAALESTRLAVSPLAWGTGLAPGRRAEVASAAEAALRRWRGLAVVAVDGADLRAAARDSQAARLLAATARRLGDSVSLQVSVQDVATGRVVGEASVARPMDAPHLALEIGRLAEAAVAQAYLVSAAAQRLAPRVRNVAALRAYDRAQVSLRAWNIGAAQAAFVEALRVDSTLAVARVALAQLEVWQGPSRAPSSEARERIRAHARRALRDSATLSRRERDLALGLEALGEERYPDACRAFDALAGRDSTDAEALFGAGECRRLDGAVRQTAAGPAFRASYYRAIQAYTAALRVDPIVVRTFSSGALWRLPAVLMADPASVRVGLDAAGARYAAVPSWQGDTLAFDPVPMARFAVGEIGTTIPAMRAARAHANDQLLGVAQAWVATAPDDADGHEILAWALEAAGRLTAGPGAPSSLASLAQALQTARDSVQVTRLQVSRVRLLLKAGRWAEAGREARTVLDARASATGESAELLAPVAILADRIPDAMRLLDAAGPRLLAGRPDKERRAVVRALVLLSSAASPDSIRDAAREAVRAVTMPPAQSLLCIAAGVAFARVGATALHEAPWCAQVPTLQAQRRLVRGDTAGALGLLDSLAARRAGAAPLTPDADASEVAVLVAIGRSGPAASRIDRALAVLDEQSVALLAQPMLAGGLVSLLEQRERLGGRNGTAAGLARRQLRGQD